MIPLTVDEILSKLLTGTIYGNDIYIYFSNFIEHHPSPLNRSSVFMHDWINHCSFFCVHALWFTNWFSISHLDIYLLGTVMLVFGMGLYELFISNLDKSKSMSEERTPYRSNLFGIFTLKVRLIILKTVFLGSNNCILVPIFQCKILLHRWHIRVSCTEHLIHLFCTCQLNCQERPKWLEIKTVSGLKTKVGHVIVMLLLIGFFEKSKKAVIHTPLDLLCFSISVLLCSGCLFLLSRLTEENWSLHSFVQSKIF